MRPRPLHNLPCLKLLALALACMAIAGPAAARAPFAEGQEIEITGAVTDAAGNPLKGRTVVLEVYRRGFSLKSLSPRQMGRSKQGLQQRTAITDKIGRYAITWTWHDYYNRFELSVGDFGADGYYVEDRADLSRRILRGSPVIVSFVLGDDPAETAAPSRRSESASPPASSPPTYSTAPSGSSTNSRPSSATGSASPRESGADKDRIRERHGSPDRTESLALPYGTETTWWYFADGRAYRFLDGELTEELTFDPIDP